MLLGSPQKGQAALSTFKFIASTVVVFLQQKDNTVVLGDACTLLPLSAGLIAPCQQPASQLFHTLAEWHKVEP
jgi:hypothetical protein